MVTILEQTFDRLVIENYRRIWLFALAGVLVLATLASVIVAPGSSERVSVAIGGVLVTVITLAIPCWGERVIIDKRLKTIARLRTRAWGQQMQSWPLDAFEGATTKVLHRTEHTRVNQRPIDPKTDRGFVVIPAKPESRAPSVLVGPMPRENLDQLCSIICDYQAGS